METWILFTLLAVVMQSLRTAGQKQIAKSISVQATTLVRFLFGLPFAILYFIAMTNYYPEEVVHVHTEFFFWGSLAALAQIFATIFLVKALAIKNFAVGTALAKTEAIMTALLGAWFFSSSLSLAGYISVFIGVAGTLIASRWKVSLQDLKNNKSIKYGLCAGLGFALASLWLRESILSLALPGQLGAATTLLYMVSLQTLICIVWVIIHEAQQFQLIRQKLRPSLFIGLTSVAGSIGWFTAIGLQEAALVKTLGQMEFFVTFALTYLYFGERISRTEYLGMLLIAISVILLLIYT